MWKLLVILVAIKVDARMDIFKYIKYCEGTNPEEYDYRHVKDNLAKYELKEIYTLSML